MNTVAHSKEFIFKGTTNIEKIQEIKTLRAEGKTVQQIVEATGISSTTIVKYINQEVVTNVSVKRENITKQEKEKFLELKAANLSNRAIATQMNLKIRTVQKLNVDFKLTNKKPTPTEKEIERWAHLYNSGYTLAQISENTIYSHTTVGKYFKDESGRLPKRLDKRFNIERGERLVQLLNEGRDRLSIQKELKINKASLIRMCKARDIDYTHLLEV